MEKQQNQAVFSELKPECTRLLDTKNFDASFDKDVDALIAGFANVRDEKDAVELEASFTKSLLKKYVSYLKSVHPKKEPLTEEEASRKAKLSEYQSDAKFAADMFGVTYKPELVSSKTILSVRNLKEYFGSGERRTKAVNNVSFDIKEGECFGLVGESGCGKTTTGRTVIGLYKPTGGEIYYKGFRLASGTYDEEREIRRIKKECSKKASELTKNGATSDQIAQVKAEATFKIAEIKNAIATKVYDSKHSSPRLRNEIQMIFQDPIDSLDPRMTVEDIITEGLHIQGKYDREENQKIVYQVLKTVGLIPEFASRYPHEFSGGQRQRIGIARAVVMNPKVLICDEPISALDVSIRAQVLNLLNDLKINMGLTMLFIAHDLSVVKYFCDRIAVMYFGNMVECATSDELFAHPLHPYTKALLSAIPKPDPLYEKDRVRQVYNPATTHDYSKEEPTLREVLPGHFVLCNSQEEENYIAEAKALDAKKGE